MSSPTEQLVEDVSAVYFGAIGAATKRGVEIDDAGERGDASQVTLKGRLAAALHRLNLDLPHDSIEEVVRILSRPPHPTLIQNNRWFHTLVTDGVEVEYREAKSGETRGGRARLVDFDNPAANELLVVRQLTVTGASGKVIRPDLTVFLNGLPVAVIELKAPTDTQADLGVAIDQLDRYMQTAPDLFVSNLALVVSDGMLTRVGSITGVPQPLHALATSASTIVRVEARRRWRRWSGGCSNRGRWWTTCGPASSSRRTSVARSPKRLRATTSSARCARHAPACLRVSSRRPARATVAGA